jgi:hypothetical protein
MMRMSCLECGDMFAFEHHGIGRDRLRCRRCRHSKSRVNKPHIKLHLGYWQASATSPCGEVDLDRAAKFVMHKNRVEGRYSGVMDA